MKHPLRRTLIRSERYATKIDRQPASKAIIRAIRVFKFV